MNRLSKFLLAAASLAAYTGVAAAEDEPPVEEGGGTEGGATEGGTEGGEATPPPDGGGGGEDMAAEGTAAPGLTLGKGKILIHGSTINVNMSASAVAKPFSLAPSISYGVSDKLTVGVNHDLGTTMYSPRPVPGAGICLASKENGCAKVYNNIGIDALFGLAAGKMSAAAHGGLDFLSLSDPMLLGLRVGVLGKYDLNDKISIAFDPWIRIGLTERDFNKEFLNVPVYLWFKANPKIAAYVAGGIAGPLDGFGDAYQIPLGLGASFMANEKLTIGADFWFTNIGGKGSSADFRALGIRAAYAL